MFNVDGIMGSQECNLNILFCLVSSLDVRVSVFPLLLDVLIPTMYNCKFYSGDISYMSACVSEVPFSATSMTTNCCCKFYQ